MAYKAILKELKDTPTDQLKELPGNNDFIDVVTEDQVMEELGNSTSANPDTDENYIPDFDIVNDGVPDYEDQDEDQDEENEEDFEDAHEIDPDEPTEIEADNFFTADQAVGLLDNTIVSLEELIFNLADVKVDKKDLHYTAKQKKLLSKPLDKAFKKTKFKIKSPWIGFGITLAGLEFAKISKIIGAHKIEKKHQEALSAKDAQLNELQAQLNRMQELLNQKMEPFGQYMHNPEPADPGAGQPGAGPVIRGNNGQFVKGTGQAKRVKGKSTRKPGETRGRKPEKEKKQTIPLNMVVNE